ncbi:hypothetical protein PAXRUDRAFT_828110 [Paxillus rubicundulus Ve08.2h10]|uniref:Unplaced genomic scaffold scaffold_293, whole genome shotgun sequence n=1 Tax=Paxillus rubicundulus Ve08.2h10 TaxID=930991 RepID=A0A0D0E1R8_9AGAM|nr:hypothetical protein PAXRUDRAFT_828110 [Paxillus rubicundulus Ve08.2h10]
MSRPRSPSPSRETFVLGPHVVPRIWVGLWQLSSSAWGTASTTKIHDGMAKHAKLGYDAFDMADHYGAAESLFGGFRKTLPSTTTVFGATKWCVFRQIDPSRTVVECAVRDRIERMNTQSVDLLQFHWQDYSDMGYLTALRILQDLQKEGLVSAVGLCNFDAVHTNEICAQFGSGFIVSNQVQFSLIDTRPLHGMADICERHNVKLLAYGTLCGGFLADKWLQQPEPEPYTGSLTPSQRKYLDVILKAWGNWTLFQTLLVVLRTIGDRHGGRSIANIAIRWVLDHPFVGAVLIGNDTIILSSKRRFILGTHKALDWEFPNIWTTISMLTDSH